MLGPQHLVASKSFDMVNSFFMVCVYDLGTNAMLELFGSHDKRVYELTSAELSAHRTQTSLNHIETTATRAAFPILTSESEYIFLKFE